VHSASHRIEFCSHGGSATAYNLQGLSQELAVQGKDLTPYPKAKAKDLASKAMLKDWIQYQGRDKNEQCSGHSVEFCWWLS